MTNRKAHILDVAESLFAKYGFAGTTTRLISETAEANIAMISYYFGGKEKLLKAILDRYAEDIYLLVKRIQDNESDPSDRIKGWVSSYLEYVFEHPNPVIIAHRQLNLIIDKPEVFSPTRDAFDKVFEQVYLTLEEGKKTGVFGKIDTELTIITLKATIEDLVLESNLIKQDFKIKAEDQGKLYPDEFKNRVEKHLLSLLDAHVFSKPK
ncbi:MAG: TetR family transcriptional regulator [Balneolales bacterium]